MINGTAVSKSPHLLEPGEYTRHEGHWYAVPPGCPDLLANLRNHEVIEHEDGTITAAPSIKVTNGQQEWHGYLEKGQWREC